MTGCCERPIIGILKARLGLWTREEGGGVGEVKACIDDVGQVGIGNRQ
jgi:hypothetical protein